MSQPELNPAEIREMAMGFQRSRVVLTGIELRVWTALGDERLTSAALSSRLGTHPRATDRLLNALVAIGLLAKADGLFANTRASGRYLVETSPDFIAGMGHTASMWRAWSGMTDAVRQGAPAVREAINDRGEGWLEPFIAAMHYRAALQAPVVASMLDLGGVARVLDVGGGSGAFAMAFARQNPSVQAVVLDLPNVLPITRRYVEEAGLSARVTTATGDYLKDPLPGGFDLAFLSAVVHSNSPEENAALVRKCAAALNPGGRVAIMDWVMEEERTAPAMGAMFALNMLVATDHGDTFTEGEMRRWIRDAGLAQGPRLDMPFGSGIVTGLRR
jgi:2-polyprenyl-3-methyl-5-hydroxy-6-metoxy-1,4-benzoquinol methylase